MLLLQLVRLLHIVGVTILVTSLLGGWLMHRHYRRAGGWETRLSVLKAGRTFGFLSPVGILILLGTGIGKMLLLEIGPFSTGWLSAKLVLFLVALAYGGISGRTRQQRWKLVDLLAKGTAPAESESRLQIYDRRLHFFFLNQTVLILIILGLSMLRPD